MCLERTCTLTEHNETLGIDVGGVIIDRANDVTDTSFFSENFLQTTAVPGAFGAIARLVRERFHGQAHVVSKCGIKIQHKTRKWLEHHSFHPRTEIPRDNVHFCINRHDKAPICKELGITHFIDDRLDVLTHMEDLVPHCYLFNPRPDDAAAHARDNGNIILVASWEELLKLLLTRAIPTPHSS